MFNVFKSKISEKFGQKILISKSHVHEFLETSHNTFTELEKHHFDKNLFTGYQPKYFIKKGFPNHFTFSKTVADTNYHHNVTITHAKKIEKLDTIDLPSTNAITIRDANDSLIQKLDYSDFMLDINHRTAFMDMVLRIEMNNRFVTDNLQELNARTDRINNIKANIKHEKAKMYDIEKIISMNTIKPTKINISLVDSDQIKEIGINASLYNRVLYESGLGHRIDQVELIKRAIIIKTLEDIKDFHRTGALKILIQSNNKNNIMRIDKDMLDLKIDENTEKINNKIILDRDKEIFIDTDDKTKIIDNIGEDNYNLCVNNTLRIYREILLLGGENVEANCDFWIALEHSGKSGSTNINVLEQTLDDTINGIIMYPPKI